jgi:AcrR family transcriptional regulator
VTTHSASGSRRERIVEAALDLFAAKGFDRTSTKEIARAAGVAEGLIFHHFDSKESLLAALFETRRSYFSDLQALSSEPPDLPAEQVLTQMATEALARLRRERRIAIVLFGTAQTNPGVRARLEAVIREGTGHLARYLAARRDRGELRRDLDVETAAFAFLSPLFLHFLVYRDLPAAEWEERSAAFVHGLVATWLEGSLSSR